MEVDTAADFSGASNWLCDPVEPVMTDHSSPVNADTPDELRRVAKWLEPGIDLAEPDLLGRAADEIEELREELESARAQVTIAKQSNGFQLLDGAQQPPSPENAEHPFVKPTQVVSALSGCSDTVWRVNVGEHYTDFSNERHANSFRDAIMSYALRIRAQCVPVLPPSEDLAAFARLVRDSNLADDRQLLRLATWLDGLAQAGPALQSTPEPVTYQLRFRRESGEWSEWQNVVSPWDGSRNPAWEYRPLYAAFSSPESQS